MTANDALVIAPRLHGADGVSILSRQFVYALAGMGHRVESWVLSDEHRGDLIEGPAKLTAYSASGRVDLMLHGLWSACRQHFDRIVVTHLHLLPVVAAHIARGTPFAVSLNGIECWVPLGGVREALLDRADVLLAISSYTAARFVEANPRFARRTIHICPPAVPDDIVSSPLAATNTVLVVGRLSKAERYKGHDALLDIWPEVVAALPDAELVFVGDGDDRPRLEARIRNEGLAGSVRSLGLLSREQLRRAYADCRVFALPSRGEGFGIVFLEAMAAGRPCIGSPGGAEDVIDPGRTGLIVDPTDDDALKRALLKLLLDDELCRQFGHAGAARAARQFSLTAMTSRLSHALGVAPADAVAQC